MGKTPLHCGMTLRLYRDAKVFGPGVVVQVTPVGGDNLVEIDFEKVGKKKTMAKFAPLEKL